MDKPTVAVVGIGATGVVLAAALLTTDPDVFLVDPQPGLAETLVRKGLGVTGEINYEVPVKHALSRVEQLEEHRPDVIFVATKTFHLPRVLKELEGLFRPGMKIVSTHNGLGTEDVIADRFGPESALRMSLNYGVSLKGPGQVAVAFFNRPNHMGGLLPGARQAGAALCERLTAGGLDTVFVDDIKLFVWKKMIMKCTMASICAVTDMTIKEALTFPATREIADACFQEALTVARAKGYDLGEDYLDQALAYLEKVGVHKDSMCFDLANRSRTEIDFLGGKVVEYGRETGVATPCYAVMTNLVKTVEDKALKQGVAR
ncbi:MAG: 2-dehydropantoate 2-reductase [Deltaproteobacteria bacterium]|nr:2-dehydropantoate 2-reductase [Deltaproteobacteria bacterium]